MSVLSPHGRAQVESLARQTGFSEDAVEVMLAAIVRGGRRMAQFDHPEFGGSGQWMHGGMLMLADFSNGELKRRVDRLCDALAEWVAGEPEVAAGGRHLVPSPTSDGVTQVRDAQRETAPSLFDRAPAAQPWYPASLGTPDSSGSQNHVRYAWFAASHRLALDDGGTVTVFDTGDHRIGGVSQQQGAHGTVAFVSQHGTVDVDRFPVVDAGGRSREGPVPPHQHAADSGRAPEPDRAGARAAGSSGDPFIALEKLADLHARGIVGDDEFAAKKAELVKRI